MDRIDFKGLADRLLANAESVLAQWFPEGVVNGHEFKIGSIHGEAGDSLSVNLNTGQWCDFGGAEEHRGGDLTSLYAWAHRDSLEQAMRDRGWQIKPNDFHTEAARELEGGASKLLPVPPSGPKAPRKTSKWTPVLPVPSETPQPPDRFARNEGSSKTPRWVDGRFIRRWTYHDADGRVLGHVARFHWPKVDAETGEILGYDKDVVPQTWCVDEQGKHAWRTRSFPVPRPLYGLRELAERPDAPVIVVEGEKSADAARQIAPHYVVIAWPGGVEAWRKAALNPLRGRPSVLLWPDADEPGVKGMWEVGHALFAMCPTVKIILPTGKPDGWDAADALADGWGWREFKEWALPLAVLITEQGAGNGRKNDSVGGAQPRDAAGSQAADTRRAGRSAGPADQASDRANGAEAGGPSGEPGDHLPTGRHQLRGSGAGEQPVRRADREDADPQGATELLHQGLDSAQAGARGEDRGLGSGAVSDVGSPGRATADDRRPAAGSGGARPGAEGRAPDGADGDRGVLSDAAPHGPDGADREDRSAVSRAPAGREGGQGVARSGDQGGTQLPATAAPEPQSQVSRWLAWGLDRNGNGLPLTNLNNAVAVLENDPVLQGLVWFDEFLQRMLTGDPVREWTEPDDVNLTLYMQRVIGIQKMGSDVVRQAVKAIAYRNVKNCARDWLTSLTWDRTHRAEQFFQDIFGADDTEYIRAAGRNFWISIAARVCSPGCQVDNMVVLEGLQGKGKSSALQVIGGEWYAAQHESPTNMRAFAEILQGKIIAEIEEMHAFSRVENEAVKKAITVRSDRFRPSGAHGYAKDHPRTCVFAGTTNRDDWNKDETGARRQWPIRCRFVEMEALKSMREQYFAEAVARYKAGDSWWEMPEEETKAEQQDRYDADPWLDAIAKFAKMMPSVTANEVMQEALKIPVDKLSRGDQMRVGSCLRFLGWTKKPGRRNGGVTQVWYPPTEKVATGEVATKGSNTQAVDSPIPF